MKVSAERYTKLITDSQTLTDQCIQSQISMGKELLLTKDISKDLQFVNIRVRNDKNISGNTCQYSSTEYYVLAVAYFLQF